MLENENYAADAIKDVPLTVLAGEFQTLIKLGNEAGRKGGEAYERGDLGEAFAWTSEAAVYSVKSNLIESEVQRRDLEDGPMSEDEARAMTNMVLEALGL